MTAPASAHLVTVRELLEANLPLCCLPGPAYSRCTRAQGHPVPCAALGTDAEGRPVVVTWYRPPDEAWLGATLPETAGTP